MGPHEMGREWLPVPEALPTFVSWEALEWRGGHRPPGQAGLCYTSSSMLFFRLHPAVRKPLPPSSPSLPWWYQTPPSCDVSSATLPITALVVEEEETGTSSSRISEPWVVLSTVEGGRGDPPDFRKGETGECLSGTPVFSSAVPLPAPAIRPGTQKRPCLVVLWE